MTDFAFGRKWGFPVRGVKVSPSARAWMPSRNSIAPSASPVNPMPVSAKKLRRLIPGHPGDGWESAFMEELRIQSAR